MGRIRMILEYDGRNYHGFQIQQNAHTIQAAVEDTIFNLTGERVSILFAGRTDAGVHALGQVIAFNTSSSIPAAKWQFALNSLLPNDIRVLESGEAQADFHPRFHARSKTYCYLLYRQRQGALFYRYHALCLDEVLDTAAMKSACDLLLGRHDFRSFCASGSSVKNYEREVTRCQLREKGPLLVMEIEADGFLYNMVRIIMGTLLDVGRKIYPPEHMERIIAAGDRSLAGATAPPQGLYLKRVNYPQADERDNKKIDTIDTD